MKKKVYRPAPTPSLHVQPLNLKQDQVIRSVENNALTIAVGSVGTGKTYVAVATAVKLWSQGRTRKLIFTRSNIPTGRTLGSFPGTVEEKLAPWLAPMLNVVRERAGADIFENQLRLGNFSMQPLETIRGASFDDSIILVDEAQNLTLEELKAVTTRIGTGSKLVLMGDPNQSDLRESALDKFSRLVVKHNLDAGVIRFTIDDIVRSDIVGQLARMFEVEGL